MGFNIDIFTLYIVLLYRGNKSASLTEMHDFIKRMPALMKESETLAQVHYKVLLTINKKISLFDH